MKKRFVLGMAALLVIFGSLAIVAVYRVRQVPSLLTIFVTLNYLSQNGDHSYAGQTLVSMELTSTNETADNVTLVPPPFSNQTTKAYWTLQIVLNESEVIVPTWTHDIEKSNVTAGQFSGTVSKSFAGLNGNFTVWIVLWSASKASTTMLSWTSENITVF